MNMRMDCFAMLAMTNRRFFGGGLCFVSISKEAYLNEEVSFLQHINLLKMSCIVREIQTYLM